MNYKVKIYLFVLIAIIYYFKMNLNNITNISIIIFGGIVLLWPVLFKAQKTKFSEGISIVSKELVFNNNTLKNDYCIVRYINNEKIIVIENPKLRECSMLRAFIINKSIEWDIESCWKDICSMYDTYTYFDSLLSFIDKSSKRVSIIFLDSDEKLNSVSELSEFLPKKREIKPVIPKPQKSNIIKSSLDVKGVPIVVNFSDLRTQEVKIPQEDVNPQNVENLEDLASGKKIYINYADADTISILPGINIVKAKKLVAYRNIHGLFKTKKDFISLSGVKEHFIEKIMKMISLDKYDSQLTDVRTLNIERIVD